MSDNEESEEISERKLKRIRARRQFKALVRLVIANLYWLNVGRYVKTKQISLKKRTTGKFLLTTNERRILRIAPEYRSEAEITLLTKVLGDLKCFRKYPEDVKRVLIGHTFYEYLPPNRVIVRQNAIPMAMYFIITGQLEIVTTKYMKELDEHTVIGKQYFNAGDAFGDTALLQNSRRMATVTTITHCELLVLHKFYFDTILRTVSMEQWKEIRWAIEQIPFFDKSTDFFKTEMCVMAQIVRYRRNEAILGDGIGKRNMVHFIVSGKCSLIEHIPLRQESSGVKPKHAYMTLDEEKKLLESQKKERVSFRRKSFKSSTVSAKSIISANRSRNLEKSEIVEEIYKKSTNRSRWSRTEIEAEKSDSFVNVVYPPNIDVRYIEICTYSPKSVFGVGENFKRRRVVANTAVTCLLVPNNWLLPQSNDWIIIRDYLNNILPDTKEVYRMYLQDRKFKKFKDDYIKTLVARNPICNSIHNVPYSIRIKEDFAFRFNQSFY